MKSVLSGKSTSVVKVLRISSSGFWLLLNEQEKFVAYEFFPWFRDAADAEIRHVEWPSVHRLYWPDLDIDISVESLDHPERFPLVSDMSFVERLSDMDEDYGHSM